MFLPNLVNDQLESYEFLLPQDVFASDNISFNLWISNISSNARHGGMDDSSATFSESPTKEFLIFIFYFPTSLYACFQCTLLRWDLKKKTSRFDVSTLVFLKK